MKKKNRRYKLAIKEKKEKKNSSESSPERNNKNKQTKVCGSKKQNSSNSLLSENTRGALNLEFVTDRFSLTKVLPIPGHDGCCCCCSLLARSGVFRSRRSQSTCENESPPWRPHTHTHIRWRQLKRKGCVRKTAQVWRVHSWMNYIGGRFGLQACVFPGEKPFSSDLVGRNTSLENLGKFNKSLSI